ncbi:MAG: hypothetical protein ABW032_03305 [Burkholderiaceae bacterium]
MSADISRLFELLPLADDALSVLAELVPEFDFEEEFIGWSGYVAELLFVPDGLFASDDVALDWAQVAPTAAASAAAAAVAINFV